MKPEFALALSSDGISLFHRASDGWRVVGEISLAVGDLGAALADLRAKTGRDAPLPCKVILPEDQIRYLTVHSDGLNRADRAQAIADQLDAATPYALEDLAFDQSVQGEVTHVAAVARDTLDEAQGFCLEYGFAPLGYVAAPSGLGYQGEPFFGRSPQDRSGRQGWPQDVVHPVGPARMPLASPAADPEDTPPQTKPAAVDTTPDTGSAQAQPAPPDPETPSPAPQTAPSPGFASRRKRPAPVVAEKDLTPKGKQTPVTTPVAQPDPPKVDAGFASKRKTPVAAPAEATLEVPDDLSFRTPSAKAPGTLPDRPSKPAGKKGAPAKRPDAPGTASVKTARKPKLKSNGKTKAESDRMTVFGAREEQRIGGKPKFLGLALTAILLLFLAAVAAWASLFLDDGISGLFGRPSDTAVAQAPPDPEPDPQDHVPATPARLPNALDPSSLPSLSDTDTAVLDALGTPQTAAASPEATDLDQKATYAATGIWPVAPTAPDTPFLIDLDDLYVAAIDHTDLSQDAVALPQLAALQTDLGLNTVTSPAAAGAAAPVEGDGLVAPTPTGALTPDGILVFLGRPDIVPPPTPVRFETAPETEQVQQTYLAALRPRLRPQDLSERNQRANLGGKSLDELARLRPRARPKTAKQIAEEDETPTAQAVVVSRLPKARPRNFDKLVAKAKPRPTATAAAVASASTADVTGTPGNGRTGGTSVSGGAVKPAAPSPASVARQATLQNAINMQRLNLIGVHGTPSNRSALIRLPSGRLKKVKVGDRVDGGQVIAIGDSDLRYQKGSRVMTLKIPSG